MYVVLDLLFQTKRLKGDRQESKLHNAPTHWQGEIVRSFVLPSGKTSLTSRKPSAGFNINTGTVVVS